jgi:RPA family protein
MAQDSRQTFVRSPGQLCLIEDLLEGRYNREDHTLQTRYGVARRVRVMGTVLEKNIYDADANPSDDGNASQTRVTFQLDDGTGRIWATCWGIDPADYEEITPGILVDAFARLRDYRDSIILVPEIIRAVDDPNFETLRWLAIVKKRRTTPRQEIGAAAAIPAGESPVDRLYENAGTNELEMQVLQVLQTEGQGGGLPIGTISARVGVPDAEAKAVLERLSREFLAYESTAGHWEPL